MDISDILSSLSPDDINKLKEAAASVLGSQSAPSQPEPQENAGSPADLLSAFGKLTSDDERTALLKALRPLLSEQRQKKTDEAIKLLRLMSLLPVLKDSGLLGNLL